MHAQESPSLHSENETNIRSVPHENLEKPIIAQEGPTTSESRIGLSSTGYSRINFQQSSDGFGHEPGELWITGNLELWMIGCFAVMATMVSLDGLIMITSLKNILSIYNSNFPHNASWPIAVYFLATIPSQRLSMEATEVFGRRNVLCAGVAIFTAGIIFLSASPASFPMLLVGRGVQGAGVGAIVAVASGIMTEMIPPGRRSKYYCVILFCAAIGVSVGPAIGGVLLQDTANWRWIYYISAPFCFCLLIMTPLTVRPVGETPSPLIRILKFDWTGICLLSGSCVLLILGAIWAGIPGRAADWHTLLTLSAGAVGLLGFFVYEKKGASRPIVPLNILTNTPFTFACIFIHSVVMFTELFYIPEYARGVYRLSPSYLGALLISLTASSLLVTAVVGVITARFRAYRWAIWSGWVLTITTAGCMILPNADTSLVVWVFLMIIAGIGHGLVMSGSQTALQRLASASLERDASLLANLIRTVGICIAMAAGGTTLRTRLRAYLFQSDLPKLLGNLGFSDAFLNPPKIAISDELDAAEREIFVLAFDDLMYAITALAGIGGLLSLRLVQRSTR